MKVMISDVIEALAFVNDEIQYFYSIRTEEILMVWDSMVNGETSKDLIEEMEENFEEYILLPDKHEIDEYNMMVGFIDNLTSGSNKDELHETIRGKGAFQRFKDKVSEFGLEQRWYKYRDDSYEKVAVEWCIKNKIEII